MFETKQKYRHTDLVDGKIRCRSEKKKFHDDEYFLE